MNLVTRENAGVPTYYSPVKIPLENCQDARANRSITDEDGVQYELEGVGSTGLDRTAYCSAPTDYNPLYLEGTDDSDTYAYVRIMISPCDVRHFTCIMFYEEGNLIPYM